MFAGEFIVAHTAVLLLGAVSLTPPKRAKRFTYVCISVRELTKTGRKKAKEKLTKSGEDKSASTAAEKSYKVAEKKWKRGER